MYILSDLTKGLLVLFVLWSIPVVWLILVLFRYIRGLHAKIDRMEDANARLMTELEQIYSSQSQDWIDQVERELFKNT